MQLPFPTAWDYYFDKRNPSWVLVHLKDGTLIGGLFGDDSYATSFPTDGDIYLEKVAKAEKVILDLGFMSCRVRLHDNMARIEIDPKDFLNILDPKNRIAIIRELKKIGFLYVAVDLEGYTQGSMNR